MKLALLAIAVAVSNNLEIAYNSHLLSDAKNSDQNVASLVLHYKNRIKQCVVELDDLEENYRRAKNDAAFKNGMTCLLPTKADPIATRCVLRRAALNVRDLESQIREKRAEIRKYEDRLAEAAAKSEK